MPLAPIDTGTPRPPDEADLTVLMPVKDYDPRYLRRSVDSILTQTSPAWRLLIIVEAADHAHFAAVLGWALVDTRVRLIVNQGRKLAGAINSGMRHAETAFVAILLADDLWTPDAVAILAARIHAAPEVDFFHSARRLIDDYDQPISSVHPSRTDFSLDDFKRGSPVKHLLCWRRSLAVSFGGLDETLNSVGPDDYDFPWTMAEHGARFQAVPECLYYYRDHRECFRLTTHLPQSVHRRELHRIMKKHGVGWRERRARVREAQRGFLRQCLYRNALDRWIKDRVGYDVRRGWRQRYR